MDRRTRIGKYILMAVIVVLLGLSTPHLIFADDLELDADMSVFATPTVIDSVHTGAATYDIPIEVPPGRNGMQPKLSLKYNSYHKNGWIGAGWDLDIGSIQRSVKYGLNYSNTDFEVSLNGSSSELVSRSSSWGTNYYGAKIEGAFTKYYYNSSSNYWVATTKDGTIYYFGRSTATRQYNTYGTFKWCLDKVIDTNGNYITITYQKDNGKIYPYRIYYTYNSGLSYNKYVQFTLEGRTDDQISYKTKTAVTTAKRLETISVYADSSLVRQYDLSYGYNSINGRSRLTEVQITGANGETTIQPLTFEYYNGGNLSFDDYQTTYINSISGGIQFGDINGDGNNDFIKCFCLTNYDTGVVRIYVYPFISNGDGTFTEKSLIELASSSNVVLADVDGDGNADLINNVKSGGYNVYVYPSNGNGTFGSGIISTVDKEIQRIIASDLNGDGMADLIRVSITSNNGIQKIYTSLATGNGYFESGYDSHDSLYGSHIFVDINGDGYSDLINYDFSNEKVYAYESLGNGTFESTCSETEVKCTSATYFADINGDGMADIIQSDDLDGNVYYYLAKGDGTFTEENSTVLDDIEDFTINSVADFNGDGLADISLGVADDGIIYDRYIAISKGDCTFETPTYVGDNITSKMYCVDVNGDGMADVIKRSDNCMCISLAKYAETTEGEKPADFLKKITNEYGGTTTLRYGKSSEYLENYCPFTVFPLSKTITNEPINSVVAETEFDYQGAFYEPELREFWGFETVWQTNDDGTEITTYYHQDEDLKGRPYRVLIEKPDGTDLKNTTYAWDINSTFNFVYLDYKTIENIDTGTETKEEYTYNTTNGNLLTTIISDETSGSNAETVTTTNTYSNKGTWVWRKTRETITGSSSGIVRRTTYGYESTTGNLLTTTYYNDDGSDPVVTNTYDDYGNLETVTDARGNASETYVYDSTYTYPETITDAASHTVEMEWDNGYGKITSKTDNNGNETTYEYDGYGRLKQVDYPDGGEVIYTYYDTSSPRYVRKRVKETSSSYVPSYEYYDGFGRVIKNKSTGENSKTILTKTYYDEMGRNIKTEGPYFSGDSAIPYVQMTYDYLGRPVSVETSKGSSSTTETSYSYSGFSTTITDPDGKVKVEKKDYLGRIIEVQEDDGGGTTYYEYNAAGDLLEVEDDDGNITSMTYDTLGRKLSMTDPDMGTWDYEYDNNGNLETQTDAKDQTITFTYDALNRMTYKDYSTSDPDVTYVYDSGTEGIGFLYKVYNGNVTTVNNSYDEMGRVTKVTKTITGDSARVTEYDYDLSGKVISTNYPGDYDVTNTYYAGSNLLYQVTDVSTVYATISDYEPTGKIGTLVQGNGATTTYSYNDYTTRLTGIATVSGGSTIQDKSYYYSDAGDISSIVDYVDGVTYNYYYDDLHRLTDEINNGSYDEMSVSYDTLGNIESKTAGSNDYDYYYNTSHKHAVSTINLNGTNYSFTYDANGNMLSGYDFTVPSSPVARTITWNADNMPSTITYDSTTSSFLYDGIGTRTKKSVTSGGTTTDTYYIGDHYEVIGGVVYKYIFAGNLRVAQIAGSTVSYFHKDHLGSSTVMTNSSGTQIEYANYEPFGGMRDHSGTDTSDYKFTDQELDAENGLYNYDARLYDPVIGRFITPDTIVPEPFNPQSLNRYAYCLNNPLRYTDPSGHQNNDDDDELEEYTLEEITVTASREEYYSYLLDQAETQFLLNQLFNQNTANIMWNETCSLHPQFEDPQGKQDPSNYDPNSVKQLNEAERRVAGVCDDTPDRCSKGDLKPNLKNPLEKRISERIKKALITKIEPGETNHFVIWPSNDGKVPNSGIEDKWPYTHTDQITNIYGPFRHFNGGSKSWENNWYFFFYTGKILKKE